MTRLRFLALLLAVSGTGCVGQTPADEDTTEPEVVSAVAEACGSSDGTAQCHSSRGITTCVTTTSHTETRTHMETSGCVGFDGTNFVPGRRTRTFQDTVLVTETTTTRQNKRTGKVFGTSTTTQEQILSSVLLSDVCAVL